MAGYRSPYEIPYNRLDPYNSVAKNVIELSKYFDERNKQWALNDTGHELGYTPEEIEKIVRDYPKMVEREKSIREKVLHYSLISNSHSTPNNDPEKESETELMNRYYPE